MLNGTEVIPCFEALAGGRPVTVTLIRQFELILTAENIRLGFRQVHDWTIQPQRLQVTRLAHAQ